MRLLNKKALVTGANRSIGKAIALQFALEGADVVISYRSDEKGASEVVEEIKKAGKRGAAYFADFDSDEGIAAFFHQAIEFLGGIDILVNNAAGYNTKPFLELTTGELKNLFQVSVTATFLLSQLSSKSMKNGGSIIHISSISGLKAYPSRVAHSAAKAAVNSFTQNMALELAPLGIRVNAIAPGWTPYDSTDDSFLSSIPLKRPGTPLDQAHAAVFLASEESSWMTGQILIVDGGQTL